MLSKILPGDVIAGYATKNQPAQEKARIPSIRVHNSVSNGRKIDGEDPRVLHHLRSVYWMRNSTWKGSRDW